VNRYFPIFIIIFVSVLGCVSCTGLRKSTAILTDRDYKRMIVGRLDAEYVGTDNCVAKCHRHEKIADDFKNSVHGEQIRPDDGLPLVNCESCHGAGSLAIAGISDDVAANDARNVKCNSSTFLDIRSLPSQAKSLICLRCHKAVYPPMLTNWNAAVHALNNVSCIDCHKLHQGPQQKVSREKMSNLCFSCHPEIRAETNLFSHHPLRGKKMVCVDCHNPHGSNRKLLLGVTLKDTCTRCHMEKQGLFAFNHGNVSENCLNCHTPHGSVNNNLLKAAIPVICLQCHRGHTVDGSSGKNDLFLNRCIDCHSHIHNTDISAPAKAGNGLPRQ
jgi:DmsE family decaheme c-type cytochrome